jgi:hypothetical protein
VVAEVVAHDLALLVLVALEVAVLLVQLELPILEAVEVEALAQE